MIFVTTTTMTAGVQLVGSQWPPLYKQGRGLQATLNIALTIFVIASVGSLMILAIGRWIVVLTGSTSVKQKPELGRQS